MEIAFRLNLIWKFVGFWMQSTNQISKSQKHPKCVSNFEKLILGDTNLRNHYFALFLFSLNHAKILDPGMFQILIKCKIGNINVILGEKSGRNFHSIWEEAMRGNWEHLTLLSLHYFARAEKEGQRRVFPFKKKISAFSKRKKIMTKPEI